MAILNVDLTDARNLSKADARAAFIAWRDEKCPMPDAVPFEGKKEIIAGKERTWRVCSWGDYQDASGHYRRFVSYRCGLGNLSRVYAWIWNEKESRWYPLEVQGFGSW